MIGRHLLALCVALCALAAAGCGGGGSAAGEGAAGIVPAGVPIYVSINTDFGGDQITQAEELLSRFPGAEGGLGMLESELETDGEVDFEQDVRPALGPALDLVFLELPRDGSEGAAVVLLQPDDPAKLDALIAKAEDDERPVKTEVEGWTVLAQDQAALDAFEAARGDETLEDSEAFGDAMDGLEEDALMRLYVAPDVLDEAIQTEETADLGQLEQLFDVNGFGLTVSAEENGFQVEAAAKTEQGLEGFEPELPEKLPAGALAYLGFGNAASAIREGLNTAGEQNPELDQQIAQLEFALGLSLDEDVLPLVEQESAVAVYPGAEGAELPSVMVALRVDDEAEALATIDRVLQRANEFSPEVPRPTESEVGGAQVRELTLPDGTTVVYGGFDGTVFATNDSELVTQLTGDGDKLADDAVYSAARESADVPDEVESIVFVNLDEGVGYALGLAERNGESVPSPVSENLDPLASFVLYSTRDGDRSTAAGFLALDE